MVSTPWWCCSNSLERIWKSSQINCTYTVVSLIVLLYTRPHSNMLHTSSQFSDWLGFDTFFLSIFCLAQVTLPGQFCPSRHRISFKYIKVLGWLFDIKKWLLLLCFQGLTSWCVYLSTVGVAFSNSPEDAPRADGVCVPIHEHHSFAGRTTSCFSFSSFSPSNIFDATKECG